jgi:poly-gamma-glutamate capsule biosynthesis protein CapA/YwtB (metallophosphatase superfamily)
MPANRPPGRDDLGLHRGHRGTSRLVSCAVLASLLLAAWAPARQPGGVLGQGSAANLRYAAALTEASAPTADLSSYPWLYLRGGVPLAADEHVAQLVAAGDVLLGRGVAGVEQPLAQVAPWLSAADVAMANLECVVAVGGTARRGPYRLRAPLSAVAELRNAGFDLLGLANNHSLDFGAGALAEMSGRLRAAGIDIVGAGPRVSEAGRPVFRQVGGLRLAFLAFNLVPDPDDRPADAGWARAGLDPDEAAAWVAAARAQADAAIVSVHWGSEYALRPEAAQRTAARAMVKAGADLVIGHHPHVVQGTDVSGGSFVAYSLGNLLFDQQQGETRQGLVLRAFFDDQGLRAVQALPVWAGPRPRLMALDEATPILARVQPPLPRVGFACEADGCQPADVVQDVASGSFRAGSIDLTGDGVPEQVQLLRERITIYSDGAEVWTSPQEWQVVDAALGDPNDDGRGEAFLAFWRSDGPDLVGSHPFIIGHRRGAYRVLWGGSAVENPILEVDLGDVDGDGVQELVVLEEQAEGTVAGVWHWYGWGFSEVWRSLPGQYRDLVLAAGEHAAASTISLAVEP